MSCGQTHVFVSFFSPEWHDVWVADCFGPTRQKNNQIKDGEEVAGGERARMVGGEGVWRGSESQSSSPLSWWIYFSFKETDLPNTEKTPFSPLLHFILLFCSFKTHILHSCNITLYFMLYLHAIPDRCWPNMVLNKIYCEFKSKC